jgi:hypothetical protein
MLGYQCAWCGRQPALDGSYHGPRLPREAASEVVKVYARHGYSHGICPECYAEEMRAMRPQIGLHPSGLSERLAVARG